MWLPFSPLIALNHLYRSTGIPRKILFSNLRARLFVPRSGISRIAKARMPYVDAVSSGFPQMQLTCAFGTCLRMLNNIAWSVHSLPRLPVPKVPKRAIFLGLAAVLIGTAVGAERHDRPHAARPVPDSMYRTSITFRGGIQIHTPKGLLAEKKLNLELYRYKLWL